ncbi:MAG: ABC transporter substrate-binding protein [Thermocladium sp.]
MRLYSEALGEYVNVPRPLNSIISLDPAATEAIFMMGAGHLIKATDAFSYRPPNARAIPKIGSYTHVDIEALRAYNPQLIFTSTGVQRDLYKKLISAGFNVYPVPVATSVSKIMDNVIIIGEVIDRKVDARRLYLELLSTLINKRKRWENPIRIYVELDLGGPISPGFPTHISDAISILGGINVFDHIDEAYFTPTPSQIIAQDPEIIIYEPKRGSKISEASIIDAFRRRGIDLSKAKLQLTPGDFLAHMGPSFITDVMRWLEQVISR